VGVIDAMQEEDQRRPAKRSSSFFAHDNEPVIMRKRSVVKDLTGNPGSRFPTCSGWPRRGRGIR
jgi:hypothetical protein